MSSLNKKIRNFLTCAFLFATQPFKESSEPQDHMVLERAQKKATEFKPSGVFFKNR